MYLLLKGKLLDSLPPSAKKGLEARNCMAASGKLQVGGCVCICYCTEQRNR